MIGRVLSQIAGIPLAEFGDTMRIEGIVVGDGHKRLVLYLPGEAVDAVPIAVFHELGVTEASEWLAQSDDPTAPIYSGPNRDIIQAIVRKAKRQVDQTIAWKVYARDGYECMYCGAIDVPLTYDHLLAQAYGGKTTISNGVSSCRPCNKAKGHMTIKEWVAFMKERNQNHQPHYKYADNYFVG